MDKEDLYTLKINCKGKRTVRRANKGINVEKNNNRCKKLKFKIIKREKKRKKEKKGKLPRTSKPNVEGEAYNNNFKT